jgi:uncharacterized protein (TIGR03067 family)
MSINIIFKKGGIFMKRFGFILFTAAIFAGILALGVSNNSSAGIASKGKTDLEGKWESTVQGQEMTFTFSGDNFSITSPIPNYHYKGTFKLQTNVDPKKIDLQIAESGIPAYAGKTSLGIYKIEGDILTLAFHEPGGTTYPSSFESVSGAAVFVLKKS